MNLETTINHWKTAYREGYHIKRTNSFERDLVISQLTTYRNPPRLIDIGCSFCPFLETYEEYCSYICLVDAIDLSSFFGDDRDNVSFVQCLMSELDQCIHEQFNMAVALRVLHNTPPQYHQICIDQVANILDKRGCLIMSVASWNDFARIHLDHPLGSRDNRHEYLTGLKFGFSLYRYYFKYSEIRSLVEERFEILLVDEITSPSGISNHPPRKYWIVLARKL